jgi:hypothetical protein
MSILQILLISTLIIIVQATALFLFRSLKKDKSLIPLAGLFCLLMGIFLLLLDIILISTTQGPQFILDYLEFKRTVSDTGFSGRWVLTSYLFILSSFAVMLYIVARRFIFKK